MSRCRILLTLGCLCLNLYGISLPSAASAAEYFVSARGQDTADGTSAAQALASIQKGVSKLKAGDILTILPGEYFGAVEVRKMAGTKEAPIHRDKRDSTFAKSAAGEPIGLDPAVFAGDFARATDRGETPKARTTAASASGKR